MIKDGPDRDAVYYTDSMMRAIEIGVTLLIVVLFAVGLFDLVLRVFELGASGELSETEAVISLIDTILLLIILVEVYHTIVAYIKKSDHRRIVTTVLYTGIIALVRKAIIFRTGEYNTLQDALLASGSYFVMMIGIGVLLFAFYRFTESTEIDEQGIDEH